MSRDDRGGRADAPDYDAMQRDIRTSQMRITETLGVLERKFSRLAPRHLMERAMERKQSYGGYDARNDLGREESGYGAYAEQAKGGLVSVGETVRSHPIPLAMIGLGLGWLALAGSGYDRKIAHSSAVRSVRNRAGDAADYARGALHSAGEHVGDAVGSAGDSVRHAGESVRGSVRDGTRRLSGSLSDARHRLASRTEGHSTGHSTRSMVSSFWDMVDEHPLVAGAMGLTLGAAIGASLPATRYENRWMGEYADDAAERAKDMAHDYVDRGQRAARAALEAAKEEVSEAVGNATTAAKDAAREEAEKRA